MSERNKEIKHFIKIKIARVKQYVKKNRILDYFQMLGLMIIIMSPVLYFSWDGVTGTALRHYIMNVLYMFSTGTLWLTGYLVLSAIPGFYKDRPNKG